MWEDNGKNSQELNLKQKKAKAMKKLETEVTSIQDWKPASSFRMVSFYLRNMICWGMSLSPKVAVLWKWLMGELTWVWESEYEDEGRS